MFFHSAVDFLRAALLKYADYSQRQKDTLSMERMDFLPIVEVDFDKTLMKMKTDLVQLHNTLVSQKGHRVGGDYQVFPYLLDTNTLLKASSQPDFVKHMPDYETLSNRDLPRGKRIFWKLEKFRKVCSGQTVGADTRRQKLRRKCRLLHHNDPYLKLGPFKMEILRLQPLRSIIHHILSEKEIRYVEEQAESKLRNEYFSGSVN